LLKRSFDFLAAAAATLVLAMPMLLIAFLVKLTSPGPVLFLQERIGRGGRPFNIFKFRSMIADAPQQGSQITAGEDPRITRVGGLLRKTKLDELPQLFNVLRGDMSLVGPRPEVPKYVELFREDYAEILRVRPGVTDLASLRYYDEATILGQASDPEKEYIERVLPEKIKFAKEYVHKQSFFLDLKIIFVTVFRLAGFH
jgi:lipopolysaccharide/colanic/teichoic acid biosynthesis glycosyltransferase